jgi:PIN domain nuclease of toxin-antitoxin system
MKLLLDTHIVLAGVNRQMAARYPRIDRLLNDASIECFVSVVSIWEIAIKSRLGKLKTEIPLFEIPDYLTRARFKILAIGIPHVITVAAPEPPTRDPFDRLLLSQCQVEGLRLVTLDQALISHPVTYLV